MQDSIKCISAYFNHLRNKIVTRNRDLNERNWNLPFSLAVCSHLVLHQALRTFYKLLWQLQGVNENDPESQWIQKEEFRRVQTATLTQAENSFPLPSDLVTILPVEFVYTRISQPQVRHVGLVCLLVGGGNGFSGHCRLVTSLAFTHWVPVAPLPLHDHVKHHHTMPCPW